MAHGYNKGESTFVVRTLGSFLESGIWEGEDRVLQGMDLKQ